MSRVAAMGTRAGSIMQFRRITPKVFCTERKMFKRRIFFPKIPFSKFFCTELKLGIELYTKTVYIYLGKETLDVNPEPKPNLFPKGTIKSWN